MSGRIKNNLIEVRQGDSFAVTLKVFENGKPANLNNNVIRMQVRDLNNEKMMEIIGNIVDADGGLAVLSITPQHSSIPVGEYKCDIQLETTDGSINTIFPLNVNQTGIFRITQQVTIKEE